MSAGTGVYHSEFNANESKDLKLLQIWLFTNKKDVSLVINRYRLEIFL